MSVLRPLRHFSTLSNIRLTPCLAKYKYLQFFNYLASYISPFVYTHAVSNFIHHFSLPHNPTPTRYIKSQVALSLLPSHHFLIQLSLWNPTLRKWKQSKNLVFFRGKTVQITQTQVSRYLALLSIALVRLWALTTSPLVYPTDRTNSVSRSILNIYWFISNMWV
jgi:hypothetical protein